MREAAGRVRMAPPFGGMNGVHQPKPAGRKIGEDQLATRLQDAEHLAEHGCGIVQVMEDISLVSSSSARSVQPAGASPLAWPQSSWCP
jgi:hypothetical protein